MLSTVHRRIIPYCLFNCNGHQSTISFNNFESTEKKMTIRKMVISKIH